MELIDHWSYRHYVSVLLIEVSKPRQDNASSDLQSQHTQLVKVEHSHF